MRVDGDAHRGNVLGQGEINIHISVFVQVTL